MKDTAQTSLSVGVFGCWVEGILNSVQTAYQLVSVATTALENEDLEMRPDLLKAIQGTTAIALSALEFSMQQAAEINEAELQALCKRK